MSVFVQTTITPDRVKIRPAVFATLLLSVLPVMVCSFAAPAMELTSESARKLVQEANPGFHGSVQYAKPTAPGATDGFLTILCHPDIEMKSAISDEEVAVPDEIRISDLRFLEGMPIRQLVIQNGAFVSLKPLAGLPLKVLILTTNKPLDLGPLSGMKLTSLRIKAPAFKKLGALSNMPLADLRIDVTTKEHEPSNTQAPLPAENKGINPTQNTAKEKKLFRDAKTQK